MKHTYLLKGNTAQKLYCAVKDLPIMDYHCHLSPKEIYEDLPIDNIGEVWLGGDHYKWRLMRTAGIDEAYITGDASWHDKFVHYAKAIEFAAGNPLYHWSHMELSMYFGIDDALCSASAEDIWNRANAYIKEHKLSARKLIEQSNVELICTTDDIVDSLEWHEKIRKEGKLKAAVLPSFRTDNLLLMRRAGYADYLQKLSDVSGIAILSLEDLKAAVESRLQHFVKMGCKFTDVGIPFFPDRIADRAEADASFAKVLRGEALTDGEYLGLVGHLYVFLGALYAKYDLVMQWHLSVIRNANSVYFDRLGGDCGVDCVGDPVPGADLVRLLDAINRTGKLPETILYTLTPANKEQLGSIAGSFPRVRCGAAWWFCDHKRGIEEEIKVISENGSLGAFLGMLTDSRSFLSYARHDYFRRILCSVIGEWVDADEYDDAPAATLVARICYQNLKELVGGTK